MVAVNPASPDMSAGSAKATTVATTAHPTCRRRPSGRNRLMGCAAHRESLGDVGLAVAGDGSADAKGKRDTSEESECSERLAAFDVAECPVRWKRLREVEVGLVDVLVEHQLARTVL